MLLSIVKGDTRKGNIIKAIKPMQNMIHNSIRKKRTKKLFIKINAIDSKYPLACTHLDALDAVLSVFYNKFDSTFVGDNTFVFSEHKGGIYNKLLKKYPKITLTDLTGFGSEKIYFKKTDGTKTIGKFSLLPKKAYTISLALPKTHDTFVYTGCLKNMFGCVIKNRGGMHALNHVERLFFHKLVRTNEIKYENLINVINNIKPDLCILDGFQGMENEGPIIGTSIRMEFAMCSLDGISLDKLASKICGLDYVPYLSAFPNNPKIKIVKQGFEDLKEISKRFKPHYLTNYQIRTSMPPIPVIDIKYALSILKRSYRIKDKLQERLIDALK